eukprot:COSAG01_NODE_1996_length_8691_cov_10.109055_7_plen_194_part_00
MRENNRKSLRAHRTRLFTVPSVSAMRADTLSRGCHHLDHPHADIAAHHHPADMLALGAVPKDKVAATHAFINAKILPKSARAPRSGEDAAHFSSAHSSSRRQRGWPPPPPVGEHDGMPCGVYVSQFALQALYMHAADHGQAALELLTSTAKNSWLNMLKQGATASMVSRAFPSWDRSILTGIYATPVLVKFRN